jgi:hypothetical protein
MHTKVLLGAILAGFIGLGYAFTVAPSPAAAADGKNLQILPKNMSKKDIKKIMRKMSDALGVECEYCHDMDDMAKDTKHKKVARDMMRMTSDINSKHLKGSKNKVTCETCHRGQKQPSK